MKAKDSKPVQKIANATAQCSVAASAYGKCVSGQYLEIQQGVCNKEFQQFKECVQKVLKRRW